MSGIFARIADFFASRTSTSRTRQTAPQRAAFEKEAELADLPTATEAERLVLQICQEIVAVQGDRYERIKLTASAAWESFKTAPAPLQIAAAKVAIIDLQPSGSYASTTQSWMVSEARRAIASQLLRRDLPLTQDDLANFVQQWCGQQYSLEYGFPGNALLGAAERILGGRNPEPALRTALQTLQRHSLFHRPGQTQTQSEVALLARIKAILNPAEASHIRLPNGVFGDSVQALLATLPSDQCEAWLALLIHAAKDSDKSKPSGKWLTAARPLVAAVTPAAFFEQLIRLMAATTPDPARPDISLDILKGLIWLSVQLDQTLMAGPVGRFAETCFRKVPGIGARSVKLGNACLWALSEMDDAPQAGAELFRLRTKLKLPSVRKMIDGRLAALAEKAGVDVASLEDTSLPNFGLDTNGTRTVQFDDVCATITLDANGGSLSWPGAGGKLLKSAPASVQRDHAAALTALKQNVKDLEAARFTQAIRLEQGWQEERRWTLTEWQRNFIAHPLRRQLAQALIWQVEAGGNSVAIMPDGDALLTVSGKPIQFPADAIARLWHPLDSDPDTVLAWRARIIALELTQPIKQAHREIYVLTDAERTTRTYSNRFAAHILRQHQFRALCQARGWRFEFLGGWDNWNVPNRPLPQHGLTVEYHVDAIDNDARSESYVPLHLSTDQVRFVGADGQAVVLETVSPILFSECLRDVDLFVAVTSVANDPNWADGGPEGRHAGYWTQWAFGDLSQNAETRRELIANLAPKLAIADKLEITDKFLIVQGQRQKYAIHFGSSNIQILPSNRYLCIVPDHNPKAMEKIRLPFAGDSLLSIILSKAFLLVDERQVKDPTILGQL